jgi:DNA mismatch repair protein PMS2
VSTNVKIVCSNISGKNNRRNVALSTQKNKRMQENVVNVFGAKFLQTLVPVEVDLTVVKDDDSNPDPDDENQHDSNGSTESPNTNNISESKSADAPNDDQSSADPLKADVPETKVVGYVSKAGEGVGRSDNDRQFLFINGRPADLPGVVRALNECWRQVDQLIKPFRCCCSIHSYASFVCVCLSCHLVRSIVPKYEMKHKPAAILNFTLPHGKLTHTHCALEAGTL